MNVTTTVVLAWAGAASFAAGISAPIAIADDPATHTLGIQGQLVNGPIVQGWTISDLRISADEIPYQVKGTLWEATATDEALQGTVVPLIFNLNARAQGGQTYRALFQIATPEGINPATLTEGQKTAGKVYFDVTGDSPDSVVYSFGGQDLLTWVQPPPPDTRTQIPSIAYPSRWQTTPATTPSPAAVPPAMGPATAAVVPAMPAPVDTQPTPAPAGSHGTPLPPGSRGTPLLDGEHSTAGTATTDVTPDPSTAEQVPHLASVGATPAPGSSQGTPIPAGDGMPPPALTTQVPAPTSPPA